MNLKFLATPISLLFIGFAINADALGTRVLWEKKLPFKADRIKMAAVSGDVIVFSQDARQIILYDKSGKDQSHWRPKPGRQPIGVNISQDGNIIVYTTSWTEEWAWKREQEKEGTYWDLRVHYSTRTGKELWHKKIEGSAFLSPDGSLVAVVGENGIGGVPLTVFNSKGDLLWRHDTELLSGLRFSPDGNYILFHDRWLYLFDRSGGLLWKKDGVSKAISVSEGGTYIATEKQVFNKQGNLILEGRAEVSGDGKRLLVSHSDKMSVLGLPGKTKIKDYSFWAEFLSYDGRFLLGHAFAKGEVRILDTLTESGGRISIGSKNFWVHGNTKDGKYFVVGVDDNKLLFCQAY